MYASESLLLGALLALLLAQTLRGAPRRLVLACFAAACAALVLCVALGQARWQMAPAWLLFAVLALLMRRRRHARPALRAIGVGAGALLLAAAALLALALPIVTLPAPGGPYAVGMQSFTLIDAARDDAYFGFPDRRRELYLQLWYPGRAASYGAPARARTLWEELYRGPLDPVALLFGYLRGIDTHAYQDLPPADTREPLPAILFSHALALMPEQNTPLMEHLASHGYLVIGVGHTHLSLRVRMAGGRVVPIDARRMREAFTDGASVDDQAAEAARGLGAAERAERILALGEGATRMNEQIAIRVADLRLVMDAIAAPPAADPALAALLRRVDPGRIGLLGMSVGGAAVMDACKVDRRCRAGVNLDGGVFGTHLRQALEVPFMSVVSPPNRIFDEHPLQHSRSDYYQALVEGTRHGDFLDISFLMPFMKWLGVNGTIAPARVVDVVNAVTLAFFDAFLRGQGPPRFDPQAFPELRLTYNRDLQSDCRSPPCGAVPR